MDHTFINVVIPFEAAKSDEVRKALEGLTKAEEGNRPIERVRDALCATGVIHFLSMTTIDPVCPAEPVRSYKHDEKSHFLIEVSSDCGAAETLSMLAMRIGSELRAVLVVAGFDLCQTALAAFLLKHNRVIGASWNADAVGQVFCGTPGMSVKRILREQSLASKIRELIDATRKTNAILRRGVATSWHDSSPRQRLDWIRDEMWERGGAAPETGAPGMKWAFVPEAAPLLAGDPNNPWKEEISPFNAQFWKAATSVLGKLIGPLLLPFAVLLLAVLMFATRHTFSAGNWEALTCALAAFLAVEAAKRPGTLTRIGTWIAMGAIIFVGFRMSQAGEGSFFAHSLLGLLIGAFFLIEIVQTRTRWWLYTGVAIVAALLLLWLAKVTGLAVVLFGILLSFTAAFVLVATVAFLTLLYLEKVESEDDKTPPKDRVAELMKEENFGVQNHLASISRLKGGLLRKLYLKLAFMVVGTGAFVCPPGFLGKNGVIHFARWMVLPGTDQLLFWSNYDNTWQAYVGDFIADSPTGVTGIWSNCVGFPKTKNLIQDGAMDRDRLSRWARRQQHVTTLWYSAYPELTADRIRINAAIRQGFASAESDGDVRDWFSLFGSKPTPPEILQLSQLPTLVLGGLSSMLHARCHVLKMNNAQAGKQWIATVARHATYGEVLPGQKSAIVIGFTAEGLTMLGIPAESMATFPPAFQQGMHAPYRARMLGDSGSNDPSKWEWGNETAGLELHVLLLLYGTTAQELNDASIKARLAQGEVIDVVAPFDFSTLPPRKKGPKLPAGYQTEPFGFVDGVSQPVIRGSSRSKGNVSEHDLVAPGELVLGYKDNLGKIPPSPLINAGSDLHHFLPDAGPDLLRRRPEFSRYQGTGQRDLGANGTFLVVRQLSQDVAAFDAWLDGAIDAIKYDIIVAAELKEEWPQDGYGPPKQVIDDRVTIVWGTEAQENQRQNPLPRPDLATVEEIRWKYAENRKSIRDLIAAKLMGRWKDGTSLVRCPMMPGGRNVPSTAPDNDFLFGKEDPSGFACPFGAHIRRANPRETRFPDDKEEIATTNRHRILRIGRRYDNRGSTKEQGLLFMCINADIERQFEFIQTTWLMNRNIHGLESEIDPFLGHGERQMTIPTPTGSIRLNIDKDFVHVKGGAYFFLPGRAVLSFLAVL